MFATHYHELNNLAEERDNVANFQVLVEETGDDLVFLHRVSQGGASRSYGIEAARLAGVPTPVAAGPPGAGSAGGLDLPRHLLAQLFDPVAQVGSILEIELLGRLLHLGFQLIDQLRQRLEGQAGIGVLSKAWAALPATCTRSASGPSCFSFRESSRKLRIELLAFLPAAVGTTPCFSL